MATKKQTKEATLTLLVDPKDGFQIVFMPDREKWAFIRFLEEDISTEHCIEQLRIMLPCWEAWFSLLRPHERANLYLYIYGRLVAMRANDERKIPQVPNGLLGLRPWIPKVEKALKSPATRDPAELGYMMQADAIAYAKGKNRQITMSQLSKLLVKDNPAQLRFRPKLTKAGKASKIKLVHFEDFKKYVETLEKITPDLTNQALDEYIKDAKDTYSLVRREKDTKHKSSNPGMERGMMRLAKKITGPDG